MAIITTKAIVLSTIKYGDTSLIVRCFTLKEGLKSYMIKGVLNSKKGRLKPVYFQPLTQLNIEANHNNKGNLNSVKEVNISNLYKTIYTNTFKQTIVLFLSEVLTNSIREEEKNKQLFYFLEKSFNWLDANDEISNFHLIFLLNLTRFLGFYPDILNPYKVGFNLIEGCFTELTSEKELIYGNELLQFKKILGIDFDDVNTVLFNKKERQQVLRIIIRYFELHLGGFKNIKSLDVIETVFNWRKE